jgi:hypothetical protein
MMLRCLLSGAIAFLCVTSASAQSGAAGSATNSARPPAAESGNLPHVIAGDHWTYQVKDEISGTIKETRKLMVTDVSKNEVAVHTDFIDSGRSSNQIFDQSWNLVRGPVLKFSPNDGSGVKFPLTPDSQWKIAIDETNLNTGTAFKRVGTSRVTGQEKITTKAGTFDTLVIETKVVIRNASAPARTEEVSSRTWFSPDVNRWVKRSIVTRQDGHVFMNETLELTEYGRKTP